MKGCVSARNIQVAIGSPRAEHHGCGSLPKLANVRERERGLKSTVGFGSHANSLACVSLFLKRNTRVKSPVKLEMADELVWSTNGTSSDELWMGLFVGVSWGNFFYPVSRTFFSPCMNLLAKLIVCCVSRHVHDSVYAAHMKMYTQRKKKNPPKST